MSPSHLLPLRKPPIALLFLTPLRHCSTSSIPSPPDDCLPSPQHQSSPPPRPPLSPACSPARLRKLIASHPDPLVAKEILDLAASLDPSFFSSPHSYPPIHALVLRLARAHHLSLADSLLRRLSSPSPGLYSSLLRLHADSSRPDLALAAFRAMTVRHPSACRPRHLNRLLDALAPHPDHLSTAVSLLNSALGASLCGGAVVPNARSLNIVMKAACRLNKLSVAYSLFNRMLKHDVQPDAESYRILMQGLCRKSQVSTAVGFLEGMLNKGYVPDVLSYTTLLNSLCRKKKLREAYKLLCRMKVKGCNPDLVHYNTVILGFCREGRPLDACKVLDDMPENGCLPNLVSYTTIVNGLCAKGLLEEAKGYLEQMVSKALVPHFSVFHGLIRGFCNVGKVEVACGILEEMLRQGVAPHLDTWLLTVPGVCDDDLEKLAEVVDKVLMTENEWRGARISEAGGYGFEGYMIRKFQERRTQRR